MVNLTQSEEKLAQYLLEGCGNREIAEKMGIGVRTVKAKMNKMFLKFGITTGIKRVKLAVLLYEREASSRPPPPSATQL